MLRICWQAHFAASSPGKTDAQAAAQRAELLKQLPEGSSLPDGLLETATGLNLVENIALLSNSADNGFVGVNMYVDDEGSIKDLPINLRASEIAATCGNPLQVGCMIAVVPVLAL